MTDGSPSPDVNTPVGIQPPTEAAKTASEAPGLNTGPLSQTPYPSTHPTSNTFSYPATSNQNQPFYNHPWQGAYSYTNPYQALQTQPGLPAAYQPQNYGQTWFQAQVQQQGAPTPTNQPTKLAAKSPSPSPSPPPPPPETYQHWDEVLISFLKDLGLTQAAAGFEADMLVLNSDWEQKAVPGALSELVKKISLLGKPKEDNVLNETVPTPPQAAEKSLDERKLAYVHLLNDAKPRSQTTINKEISAFLTQNRARNDASNRAEFLYTLAQKRHQRQEQLGDEGDTPIPSCARVDAKPIDRDVQMKYDIVKNEEGPLSRTMVPLDQGKRDGKEKGKGKGKAREDAVGGNESKIGLGSGRTATTESLPGLDERLRNIEAHLAVRYVPSPPSTFLHRLECLEEHIIMLEKDYPPWAALHFNQPRRGWPPPPRLTPIIVPPHMRLHSKGLASTVDDESVPGGGDGPNRTANSKISSLHNAVLERLEVQAAMNDLAGKSEG